MVLHTLDTLPTDITNHNIFLFLDWASLFTLSTTCTTFKALANTKASLLPLPELFKLAELLHTTNKQFASTFFHQLMNRSYPPAFIFMGGEYLLAGYTLDNSHECAMVLAKNYELEGNDEESRKYFKAAADLGNPEAQLEYGICCEMDSNEEEAYQYYLMSAQQGNCEAMYSLGEYNEKAKGPFMFKNEIVACEWYYNAVEKGDCDDSRAALDRLNQVATILGITAKRQRAGSVVVRPLGD